MPFTADDYFRQKEERERIQQETRAKRQEQQIKSIQEAYSSGTPEYRRFAESRYNPDILQGPSTSQLSDTERIRQANYEAGFISIDPRIQTPRQRAETISENIVLKRALPSTLGRTSESGGKITITKTPQEKVTPIGYTAAPKQESKLDVLRKSGEKDIIKASRLRQEGKIGYGYELLGQTKQYAADTAEGFKETIKDPKSWAVVGVTYALTRNPQLAGKVKTGLEVYAPIYAASELKQIGEGKTLGKTSGELGGYVGEFKTIGKGVSFFQGSKINLQAYPSEKKITFVGEGTVQGRKGKAVLVSTQEGSKLFFREGKKLSVFKNDNVLDVNIKTTPTKQKITSQVSLGITQATTSEALKTKVSYVDKKTSLDLDLFDIYKRKVTVTPEITKVTEITPRRKQILKFDVVEQDIAFGKPEAREDFLGLTQTKRGVEVTQVKVPEATEIGFFKRTGKGELNIFEEAPYKKLLKSKKGSLLTEEILETRKPTTYIKQRLSVNIPKISVPIMAETTRLFPLRLPTTKQQSWIDTKQDFNFNVKQSFLPTTRQEYKFDLAADTTPVYKIDLAQRQDYKIKQDTSLDGSYSPTSNPFSFDTGGGFDIALSLLPTGFGLPPVQLGGADFGRKRKGKGKKIKYRYTSSLTGIAFDLKTPLTKRQKILTGFEVRGL